MILPQVAKPLLPNVSISKSLEYNRFKNFLTNEKISVFQEHFSTKNNLVTFFVEKLHNFIKYKLAKRAVSNFAHRYFA
jgi:hypothetical protein